MLGSQKENFNVSLTVQWMQRFDGDVVIIDSNVTLWHVTSQPQWYPITMRQRSLRAPQLYKVMVFLWGRYHVVYLLQLEVEFLD